MFNLNRTNCMKLRESANQPLIGYRHTLFATICDILLLWYYFALHFFHNHSTYVYFKNTQKQ